MKKDLEVHQLVERSIQTKFRKGLWNPFIAAVKRYALISPGDRIAQLVVLPCADAQFEAADELPETERSDGGFGSTGV